MKSVKSPACLKSRDTSHRLLGALLPKHIIVSTLFHILSLYSLVYHLANSSCSFSSFFGIMPCVFPVFCNIINFLLFDIRAIAYGSIMLISIVSARAALQRLKAYHEDPIAAFIAFSTRVLSVFTLAYGMYCGYTFWLLPQFLLLLATIQQSCYSLQKALQALIPSTDTGNSVVALIIFISMAYISVDHMLLNISNGPVRRKYDDQRNLSSPLPSDSIVPSNPATLEESDNLLSPVCQHVQHFTLQVPPDIPFIILKSKPISPLKEGANASKYFLIFPVSLTIFPYLIFPHLLDPSSTVLFDKRLYIIRKFQCSSQALTVLYGYAVKNLHSYPCIFCAFR